MVINEKIRVGNIYYMLAYAFQTLRESGYADLATESFDNIQHLLAEILRRGISTQLKQGLNRDYLEHIEACPSPRGKIEIAVSIRERSNHRLVCRFDEFSENTRMNRILKTCLTLLSISEKIPSETVRSLRRLLGYFNGVDVISTREIQWSQLSWHRHNVAYEMLMNVCRLLLEGMLPSDAAGARKLSAWLDEQRMSSLYERFILGYYRQEHPQLSARAPQIQWFVDDGITRHLPVMQTDVVLKSKRGTMIIDAKFYGRSTQTHYHGQKVTLLSANLYQIFTYVKNMDSGGSGSTSGLLLYAKTQQSPAPDTDYLMGGNRISVRSLDLAANWDAIKSRLDGIAAPLYDN